MKSTVFNVVKLSRCMEIENMYLLLLFLCLFTFVFSTSSWILWCCLLFTLHSSVSSNFKMLMLFVIFTYSSSFLFPLANSFSFLFPCQYLFCVNLFVVKVFCLIRETPTWHSLSSYESFVNVKISWWFSSFDNFHMATSVRCVPSR